MGDAILCTPALRAIRKHFEPARITLLAEPAVRDILSPSSLNDEWLQLRDNSIFAVTRTLRRRKFTHAILFKNSFASGLAAFLAKIPSRIGYAREGRSIFLTEKVRPQRLRGAGFTPLSMIDYYLTIAAALGADTTDQTLELSVDPQQARSLRAKLPELQDSKGPIVILVPGAAFGPSKCWPSDRFAQTADWLISNYHATVIVSVASDTLEQKIAKEICDSSKHNLINLAERPLSLGELKVLFSNADLVLSNDTGPRHIAIAFRRRVITLFGPNDPAWTDTGYEHEIELVGQAPCVPCARPTCKEPEHLCMQAITVQMVCEAAEKLLGHNHQQPASNLRQSFAEASKSFFVHPVYKARLGKLGLNSIDAVFSFNAGRELAKENLAAFRSRLEFEIDSPYSGRPTTLFLKRYERPPLSVQFKNWLAARKKTSCARLEFDAANALSQRHLNTPKTVACGEQWGMFLEKRSFTIAEKIPNADSLERNLPDYFNPPDTTEKLKLRRDFINQLAAFVKRFHETDYRHRDLYFSHIFYDAAGEFYLIDLARTFRPYLFAERFRRKDIAQLYYSAPARYFSNTDRLRLYLAYAGCHRLTREHKAFIRKVIAKARSMAQHGQKHGIPAPFAR
jgi:heptosyltransferase-2